MVSWNLDSQHFINENTTKVTNLNASGNGSILYNIEPSLDHDKFEIKDNYELHFKQAPTFNNDNLLKNQYEVICIATDDNSSKSHKLTISVKGSNLEIETSNEINIFVKYLSNSDSDKEYNTISMTIEKNDTIDSIHEKICSNIDNFDKSNTIISLECCNKDNTLACLPTLDWVNLKADKIY